MILLRELICGVRGIAGYFVFRWWRKYEADKKQAEYLTKVRALFFHPSPALAEAAHPSLCSTRPQAAAPLQCRLHSMD